MRGIAFAKMCYMHMPPTFKSSPSAPSLPKTGVVVKIETSYSSTNFIPNSFIGCEMVWFSPKTTSANYHPKDHYNYSSIGIGKKPMLYRYPNSTRHNSNLCSPKLSIKKIACPPTLILITITLYKTF